MAGTDFGVKKGGLHVSRPAEGTALVELVEQFLGHGDIAAQVRMLSVVKQAVIENSVRADRLEHSGAIDQQDGRVPAATSRYACRKSSGRRRGMPSARGPPDNATRLIPVPVCSAAGPAGNASRRIQDGGRPARDRSASPRPGLSSPGSRALATERAKATRSARGVSGDRAERLGSKPPSFDAGMMKTGSVPIASQYAAIASSRLRKSARTCPASSVVQTGRLTSSRVTRLGGRRLTRCCSQVSSTNRQRGEYAESPSTFRASRARAARQDNKTRDPLPGISGLELVVADIDNHDVGR